MKTGIIYCPKHVGLSSPKKRWQKIELELNRQGLVYDIVQSESSHGVERLVNMMIHNHYDTIVVCGGDSALNYATNCLMHVTKQERDKVVLGVIPNGLMNDFASFWELNSKDIKKSVSAIVNRRVRKVDVGCMHFTNAEGKQENKYFLNCVNIGLIASIQRLKKSVRKYLFSRKLSYVFSLLLLVFQRMFWKIQYTINYERETHRVISMCIGSSCGFGQTPNAVPYNGMVDVTVIRHRALTHILSGISLFLRGKILNAKAVMPYRSHEIEIDIPNNTPVSVDGHSFSNVGNKANHLRINVEQEVIAFIIP